MRGYYIRSGGTVYVEDVDRKVSYATGEEYDYNVSAFKLFVQKLFSQTTQYIVRVEQKRLDLRSEKQPVIAEIIRPGNRQKLYAESESVKPTPAPRTRSGYDMDGRSKGFARRTKKSNGVEPLYHKYNWIPMMLGLLRSKGINVGDQDVVKYFVNQPYFNLIYDQMNARERAKADRYKR